MKGTTLFAWLVIQDPWTATSFERRCANRGCPLKQRWTAPFGKSRLTVSPKDIGDVNKPGDDGRRNLLLASAAALGSALWGSQASPSRASTIILEESEARRIDMFERNSPSVVFIDTFTEKQDQFSPNVMEVPLGSGSGFVWDKEGHIGKWTVTCSRSSVLVPTRTKLRSHSPLFSHKLSRDPKCQSSPSSYHHTNQEW
jgi:hypothetical protein